MLFNSYAFLFGFLPLALAGYYWLGRRNPGHAAAWLAGASLLFYGYWSLYYLPLLCGSILFNFVTGRAIAHSPQQPARQRWLLVAGVGANLALLAWYKYAGFLAGSLNEFAGTHLFVPQVVLPIGISFFTFTQIAFLVDAARGEAREYSLRHYALFVSYFPHLIAGPILHHKEMIPQFRDPASYRYQPGNVERGLAYFALGLCKKVLLADSVAVYVGPAFAAAAHGTDLSFASAWLGALCYTLQLYFDFSGYCDMAVGLSWLFNVRLPFNFDSPYKAVNIVDFWRRWHMTLSRFLRDYLYIALGGNRRGRTRRYVNLLLTMLLGGLWHGASWTFVAWGALHGVYLVINHAWQALTAGVTLHSAAARRVARIAAHALTLVAVIFAWVFFRADSVTAALRMSHAMLGGNGVSLPEGLAGALPAGLLPLAASLGVHFTGFGAGYGGMMQVVWIVVLLPACLLLPNTQQWIDEACGRWHWRPTRWWAAALGLATAWCVLQLGRLSEFLYFQF